MASLEPLPLLPAQTHSRLGRSRSRCSTQNRLTLTRENSRYSSTANLLDCHLKDNETPYELNTWRSMIQMPITRKPVLQRSDTQRSRRTWIEPLDKILKEPDMWNNPFEGLCPQYARPNASVTETTLLPERDPTFEVTWADVGTGMPRKWPAWYRAMSLVFISFATLVVIMASTAYAIGIPGMAKDFGTQDRTRLTLGVSTYLFGLSIGPLVLAPLSEMYGRRPVYIVSLFSFAILLIPSAVAPNLVTILITRFMAAFMGSVVMSSAPGTLNELADEETKTVYFSVWILGAVNGPVVGPIFAGIIFQYADWRWIHWFLVILAFTSCIVMATIPETHGAVILRRRCEEMKKHDDGRYWCTHSQTIAFSERLKVSMSRPLAMAFTEPICLFWDFFVAIIYAILYLCIVGYPIVFSQIRGWSPAVASLPLLTFGFGAIIAILADPPLRSLMRALSPPDTKANPDTTLPIIIAASILLPIGQLLFAVSAAPPNSAVVPILAGLPLGIGNMFVFLYVTNYLAVSYGKHAASALAGHASMRYFFAGALPLLAPVAYDRLGPLIIGLVLTGILITLVIIPVIFFKWGDKLKARSKLISCIQT
ncbi:transporter mfs2-like protein 1 [Fusarium oxysporum f. sp. phaseoli]